MFRETRRRMKKTDRNIREVSQLVGNLGKRLGEFVENMVLPAALRMVQKRGRKVTQIFPHATARRDGEMLEVDILAFNGQELVATEHNPADHRAGGGAYCLAGQNLQNVSAMG